MQSAIVKLFCNASNLIIPELDTRSFLKTEQDGFRRNHRTSDHTFISTTIVDKYVLNYKKMEVNYLHVLQI